MAQANRCLGAAVQGLGGRRYGGLPWCWCSGGARRRARLLAGRDWVAEVRRGRRGVGFTRGQEKGIRWGGLAAIGRGGALPLLAGCAGVVGARAARGAR